MDLSKSPDFARGRGAVEQLIEEDPSMVKVLDSVLQSYEDGTVQWDDVKDEISYSQWVKLDRARIIDAISTPDKYQGLEHSRKNSEYVLNDVHGVRQAIRNADVTRTQIITAKTRQYTVKIIIKSIIILIPLVSIGLIFNGIVESLGIDILRHEFISIFINNYIIKIMSIMANPSVLTGLLGILVSIALHSRRNTISSNQIDDIYNKIEEQNDILYELKEEV